MFGALILSHWLKRRDLIACLTFMWNPLNSLHFWSRIPFIVFITSPTTVYIGTSAKSPHYSKNDEAVRDVVTKDAEETVKFIQVREQTCWLTIRTVLRHGEFEIQELVAFIGKCCS